MAEDAWTPPRGAVQLERSHRPGTGEDRWDVKCRCCGWRVEASTRGAAAMCRRVHRCPAGARGAYPTCRRCGSTTLRCHWPDAPGKRLWHAERQTDYDAGIARRQAAIEAARAEAVRQNQAARVLGMTADPDRPAVVELVVSTSGGRAWGDHADADPLPLPGTLRAQHDWVNRSVRRLVWPAVGATSQGDVDAVGVAEVDPHAPHPLAHALHWALLDQLDAEGIPVAVVDTAQDWPDRFPGLSRACRAASRTAHALTGAAPAGLRWLREPNDKKEA